MSAALITGIRSDLPGQITAQVTENIYDSPTGRILLAERMRGLFIIDPKGVLQYSVVHNLGVGRSVDETLRVLQAFQTGGLCPANWKPGSQTLKV